MKYKIKENLRTQIIILAVILVLLVGSVFMLMATQDSPNVSSRTPVPGTLVLEKGKEMPVGDTGLTVTLISSNLTPQNCADCMEQAKIQVKKDTETIRLNFRFGGIAGFHDDTASAFGYTFIVKELQQDSLILDFKQ